MDTLTDKVNEHEIPDFAFISLLDPFEKKKSQEECKI